MTSSICAVSISMPNQVAYSQISFCEGDSSAIFKDLVLSKLVELHQPQSNDLNTLTACLLTPGVYEIKYKKADVINELFYIFIAGDNKTLGELSALAFLMEDEAWRVSKSVTDKSEKIESTTETTFDQLQASATDDPILKGMCLAEEIDELTVSNCETGEVTTYKIVRNRATAPESIESPNEEDDTIEIVEIGSPSLDSMDGVNIDPSTINASCSNNSIELVDPSSLPEDPSNASLSTDDWELTPGT